MKITFELDTMDAQEVSDAIDRIHRLMGWDNPAMDVAVPEKVAAKPKTKPKATKAADKKTEPAKEEVTDPAKGDGPDLKTVREALKGYAAIEGREAAIAILTKHGSATIGELAEDKYADVLKAVE